MMNHKHRKLWILMIALVLALAVLPLNALALTEDTLEPAPETENTTWQARGENYLPPDGKPWNRKEVSADLAEDAQFTTNGFSKSWLTDLELARTRRMMEKMAAGEVTYTGPSVVNASGIAFSGVGVYPLNPEDYDGETFYVKLPRYQPLTDEQILSLIAAFGELGIPFDPDSLGTRNCSREDPEYELTIESRSMTREEEARLEIIRTLVRRGRLAKENIPEGTADFAFPIRLKTLWLYPYRSMTDDELTLLALHTDSRWEDDPLELEQMARDAILSVYPEAGSLNLEEITMDSIGDATDNGRYYLRYRADMSTGSWEDDDFRYFDVEWVKEYGNEPEISSVGVTLSHNGFANRGAGTWEGWIAAAREWTESSLKIPDGKMPENWSVEREPGTSYYTSPAYIDGETPEWEVTVQVEPDTMKVISGGITSKKWKHVYWGSKVPGEAGYMPSNARPVNRDTVSADGKTDPQMVIRHEDYHAEDDGFYLPWLTDLELARTRELMKQMDAGTITYTGPSAVNASGTMDGRVGVYPLNPADFDGEEFYVLLPQYDSLTDEQILSLIAAFDELGIPFDPDSLCGRNCGRKMWFRQTRALTDGEEERLEKARDLVRRGKVAAEDIPEGTPDCYVEMDWYGDDASFHFYPYREMTDEEINRLALHYEEKWEDEPEKVEQFAMDTLHGLFRKPQQLELVNEEIFYAPLDREGVISYVLYVDDTENRWKDWDYLVIEKKDPGSEPEIARISIQYERYAPEERYVPNADEEAWIGSAKAWAAENLQYPDGQEPEEWTVSYTDTESPANYRTVVVTGKTEKWIYSITVNQIDLEVWGFMVDNRNWYPEE